MGIRDLVTDIDSVIFDVLGDTGRILVRESGTEPLVRVMVEGEDESQVRTHAEALAKLVGEVCA